MSQDVPPLCVWLKRDLRVVDHTALSTAIERAQGGDVFCVFAYEPEIFCQAEIHARHLTFLRECLLDLEQSLQQLRIRLILRRVTQFLFLNSCEGKQGSQNFLHTRKRVRQSVTQGTKESVGGRGLLVFSFWSSLKTVLSGV